MGSPQRRPGVLLLFLLLSEHVVKEGKLSGNKTAGKQIQ